MSAGPRANTGGVPYRLAVVGKGGVGKTAIAALLCRELREDHAMGRLLAIDADPAQGLTLALGMHPERTVGQIKETILVAARSPDDSRMDDLARTLDYMVLDALAENGNMAVLAMGRSDSLGCFCAVNDILRDAIRILAHGFDTIVIDGEAGLEQLNRQIVDELDTLLIVSDSSSRGLRTASILREMVAERHVIHAKAMGLVLNRVSEESKRLTDAATATGLSLFGCVPEDAELKGHDSEGCPLSTLPLDSPALVAIRAIAGRLCLQRR